MNSVFDAKYHVIEYVFFFSEFEHPLLAGHYFFLSLQASAREGLRRNCDKSEKCVARAIDQLARIYYWLK